MFINQILSQYYIYNMKAMQKKKKNDHFLRSNAINVSLAAMIIATAGAFLQIGGTSWDVTSHLLLQPETLITGMLINAVGIVLGITRIIVHVPPLKHKLIKAIMIPAFAALLFTTTWYVYMFALPFSNGEHFRFNLDPIVASLIALIALPLLSSTIILTASKAIGRFGAASAVVVLVVAMNIFANIIPAGNILTPLLPWYSMISILPVIVADLVLNSSTIKSKIGNLRTEIVAGMIVGSIFYVLNYPMLTWTFSLPLNMPLESINNILPNFVNSLPIVLTITLGAGAIMGMIGAIISFKTINIP